MIPPSTMDARPSFPANAASCEGRISVLSPTKSNTNSRNTCRVDIRLLFENISFLRYCLLSLFFPQTYPLPAFCINGSSHHFFQWCTPDTVAFIMIIIDICPHKRHEIRNPKAFQPRQMDEHRKQCNQKSEKSKPCGQDNHIKFQYPE